MQPPVPPDRPAGRASEVRRVKAIERAVRALACIGVANGDDDVLRVRKETLTLAAACVVVLSCAWVGTYWALGLPVAAAIPLVYQVVTVVTLVAFARSKSYPFFRLVQAAMMTVLPFLLQWTLGGFVASSAVSLWALVAAIGTLFFFPIGGSVPWFAAFLGLTALSGLLEPFVSASPAPIPAVVQTAFFVLNVVGVSLTAYLLLGYAVRERDAAYARSESLLLNVLPRSIADRLRRAPGVIAESHEAVTVLFADVVDFTPFARRTDPARVVGVLDEIFSAFDELAARHGVEKIKTIGDAYMAAAGLPDPRPDHAQAMADLALDMVAGFDRTCRAIGVELALRVGIDSGPVVAGVIGRHKFIYDLWGDTVNTAARMESHGLPGRIQVTDAVRRALEDCYAFEDRGEIEVKGKGPMRAWLLTGRLEALATSP
jgi:class 3 adenylate cyclase